MATSEQLIEEVHQMVSAMAEATLVLDAARKRRDNAIRALRPTTTITALQGMTGLSDSAVRKICDNA